MHFVFLYLLKQFLKLHIFSTKWTVKYTTSHILFQGLMRSIFMYIFFEYRIYWTLKKGLHSKKQTVYLGHTGRLECPKKTFCFSSDSCSDHLVMAGTGSHTRDRQGLYHPPQEPLSICGCEHSQCGHCNWGTAF
jgi:hypothetical protein